MPLRQLKVVYAKVNGVVPVGQSAIHLTFPIPEPKVTLLYDARVVTPYTTCTNWLQDHGYVLRGEVVAGLDEQLGFAFLTEIA